MSIIIYKLHVKDKSYLKIRCDVLDLKGIGYKMQVIFEKRNVICSILKTLMNLRYKIVGFENINITT